jgi:hypothetical protein
MEALATRLDIDASTVCLAEQGKVISARTALRYDRHFGALGAVEPGAIIARQRNLDQARKRATAEARALVHGGGGKGVSPTYRRDLLQVAATPLVAEALDQAEAVYQVLTAAAPDPWALDQLAEDAVTVAARYWSTPLDQLLPEVYVRWRQLADMLKRGPVGAVGQRVLELAGLYAFYMARIGRHTGDRALVSKFGRIAARCAAISGDPLLIGSVACDRSIVAFDAGRFAEAANVAGRAVGQAHLYCKARLVAHKARALADGKRPDEARDALAEMRKSMVDLPRMPGAPLFDEGEQLLFSAMVLAEIEDNRGAEAFAREMIAGTSVDIYQDHGLAWVTIGKACASRDPGTAADAGIQAIEINRVWPSVNVEARVRRLHRDLARDHGKVAEVARLGEAVATLRPPAANV